MIIIENEVARIPIHFIIIYFFIFFKDKEVGEYEQLHIFNIQVYKWYIKKSTK